MKEIHTYFLIFYTGRKDGGLVTGNVPFILRIEFPIRKEIEDNMKENLGLSEVVITNIIKLTKTEYDLWCSDYK